MTSSTWQIKEAVQRVLDDLPAEKIAEVLDFALFLKARWTAQAAVEGTLSIAAISPVHPTKAESAPIKVRFVQPVKDFKMTGPPVLSLIDIGELTAYFEDFNGRVINPGLAQTVSFSPDSALIAVDPLQRQLQPGDVDVRTTLTPKAFSGIATIRASTLGFEPQTYTVRITWLGVILWCVVGGMLGGFMRFLRSRGTLWKRLIVGLVVGTLGVLLYVYGFLPATSSRVLHNLIAVPVAALLAGWLGLELLDKVPLNLEPGTWHTLQLEMQGQDVAVSIDGKQVAFGAGERIDVDKTSVQLRVGGESVAFKNLRVWETTPVEGWPATKAKLLEGRTTK